MTYHYKPNGVCASDIEVVVENGVVEDVKIVGGCDGNHKGLISLVKGMQIDEVIRRLEGISCGRRTTSCPDQIAQTLKEALAQ